MTFGAVLLLFLQAASSDPTGAYLAEANKTLSLIRRCDRGADADEVVVCGRRNETERYRLPIRPEGFDKKGPIDSVSRERHRLIQEGDEGIGSCTTVGPGGYTGCFHRSTKRRCEQEVCGVAF